jgi:hypothetical protein
MQIARPITPSVPFKDRLSLKLVLLFAGTFLAVMIVMVASSLISAISDRRQLDAESDVQTPAITIDPNIQTDLAKAMSFDAIPTETVVHNPFVDHDGIGGNSTVTTPASISNATSAGGSTATGAAVNRSGTMTQPKLLAPIGPVDIGTRARHDQWVERQSRGDLVEPEAAVLGVDDLVPVGYVSGGDRKDEVMLFSISLCRTFSFSAGTQFFDGTLFRFDQAEVIFASGYTIRRKSYATNGECRSNSQTPTGGLSSAN